MPQATAAPERGVLSLTGEFVSLVRSDLVPRTGGRVGRVLVDEGRAVSKGQPLLELETDYLKLDLARAEADLKRADAAALEARRDLDRKTGLAQKGGAVVSDLTITTGTVEPVDGRLLNWDQFGRARTFTVVRDGVTAFVRIDREGNVFVSTYFDRR